MKEMGLWDGPDSVGGKLDKALLYYRQFVFKSPAGTKGFDNPLKKLFRFLTFHFHIFGSNMKIFAFNNSNSPSTHFTTVQLVL